jgi:hypothetical protein
VASDTEGQAPWSCAVGSSPALSHRGANRKREWNSARVGHLALGQCVKRSEATFAEARMGGEAGIRRLRRKTQRPQHERGVARERGSGICPLFGGPDFTTLSGRHWQRDFRCSRPGQARSVGLGHVNRDHSCGGDSVIGNSDGEVRRGRAFT